MAANSIEARHHEPTARRLLRAEDIFEITLLGDVTLSPDGARACYIQTRLDREANDYDSDLWLIPTTGLAEGGTRFTYMHRTVARPRWSPDGNWIAFLATGEPGQPRQLWVIPAVEPGGESRCLTHADGAVTDFVWSPDSSQLAFVRAERVQRSFLSDPLDAADRVDNGGPRQTTDVVTITRMYHKADGAGILNDRRTHLWTVDLTGAERRLTEGDWDDTAPAWSPDGAHLAFVSSRDLDSDFTRHTALWIVPLDGGELRRVTGGESQVSAPAWSPNGDTIAYLAPSQPDVSGASTRLWLVPSAGGEARMVGTDNELDAAPTIASDTRAGLGDTRPVWTASGDALFVLGSYHGDTPLWRVTVISGAVERLTGEGVLVESFAFDAERESIVLAISGSLQPGDLYAGTPVAPVTRRLTTLNDAFLATVHLSPPQSLTATAEDGWKVAGWLVEPPERAATERYPLILSIHGGPHAAYGNGFMFEFQFLAAQGWAVLFLNPRGSTSYGERFAVASNDDWGGADYRDLMSGLDAVLTSHQWIDRDRLGVTGGSYGGYMTNWILAHTPRFRVAVTERSVSNFVSKWGTSDIGFFGNSRQWGGAPWENLEFYLERSPLTHVVNMTTPLLILHSEQDLRCRIEQAEQLFAALKYLRREVEFVRFPDEGHELSRSGQPLHRLERLQRIATWFRRYL